MGNADPQSKISYYFKIYTLKYITQILCLWSDVFLTD